MRVKKGEKWGDEKKRREGKGSEARIPIRYATGSGHWGEPFAASGTLGDLTWLEDFLTSKWLLWRCHCMYYGSCPLVCLSICLPVFLSVFLSVHLFLPLTILTRIQGSEQPELVWTFGVNIYHSRSNQCARLTVYNPKGQRSGLQLNYDYVGCGRCWSRQRWLSR